MSASPAAPDPNYEFDTEDGRRTLADLFDGRSQLLAYNVMFGLRGEAARKDRQL